MLILSYEEPGNQIFSFARELQTKYKSSSIVTITKKTKPEELTRFERPPLLDKGWLLFCQHNVPVSVVQSLVEIRGVNTIVVQVYNKKQVDLWEQEFIKANLDYKFSDNHKIPKEKILDYICSRLVIEFEDAVFLYEWNNGYTKDIEASIASLEHLPVVTRMSIRKYTEPTFYAGLFDVVQFLLRDSKPGITYAVIVKVLYNYRYAISYLVSYVQDILTEIASVFLYVETGFLSLENYKQVKVKLEDKKISKLEDGRLSYYIRLYGKISYEYVDFLRLQLKECPKSQHGIYYLLRLMLLSQEAN